MATGGPMRDMKTRLMGCVCAALIAWSLPACRDAAANSDCEAQIDSVRQLARSSSPIKAQEYSLARLRAAAKNHSSLGCAVLTGVVAGETLWEWERQDAARRTFEQTLRVARDSGPGFLESRVQCLEGLGFIALYERDAQKGRSKFSEAMRLIEEERGPEDPLAVGSLIGLAAIAGSANESDWALQLVQRALRICENTTTPDYAEWVMALRVKGRLYAIQTRWKEAWQAYGQALALADQTGGAIDRQKGHLLMDMSQLAGQEGDHARALRHATEAYDVFVRTGHEALAARARKMIRGPVYEDRYANGSYFRVGQKDGLQVWVAAVKESDLALFVYIVNNTQRSLTIHPDLIRVEVPSRTKGKSIESLKTYSAEAYKGKARDRDNWNLSGSTYESRGINVQNASYQGSIGGRPSAADPADEQARTRTQMDGVHQQLENSFAQMSRNLMRVHTLDSHTFYGGIVYAQKRGKDYFVTVPFGGENFEFALSFEK